MVPERDAKAFVARCRKQADAVRVPEDRVRAGKPQVGQIRVSARHHGDMVLLEVEDDGAGIDPARLREALAEQGAIPAGLGDRDVMETIFATGFTTRRQADRVAGRGMGLDVVQRNISGMGGDIRVSSAPGKGTRFTILLPLAGPARTGDSDRLPLAGPDGAGDSDLGHEERT